MCDPVIFIFLFGFDPGSSHSNFISWILFFVVLFFLSTCMPFQTSCIIKRSQLAQFLRFHGVLFIVFICSTEQVFCCKFLIGFQFFMPFLFFSCGIFVLILVKIGFLPGYYSSFSRCYFFPWPSNFVTANWKVESVVYQLLDAKCKVYLFYKN